MNTSLRISLLVSLAGCMLAVSSMSLPAADNVIKIGALLPISGPGSYFGVQDKQGVELALDQLNKAGVNGYKFDVHYIFFYSRVSFLNVAISSTLFYNGYSVKSPVFCIQPLKV